MNRTFLIAPLIAPAIALTLLAGCQKKDSIPAPKTSSAPLAGSTLAAAPAATPGSAPGVSPAGVDVAAAPVPAPDMSNTAGAPPNPQTLPPPAVDPQASSPRDAKNYADRPENPRDAKNYPDNK